MQLLKERLLRVAGSLLFSMMILLVVVLLPMQVSSHTETDPKEEIHELHERIVPLPEDS